MTKYIFQNLGCSPWIGVAFNEWLQGNQMMLSKIPDNLKSKESDLEVSERLRQLSTALKMNRVLWGYILNKRKDSSLGS